jgi:hypothetical protein
VTDARGCSTYLYTPVLRGPGAITFRNSLIAIFLAMLISGFWHRAGWTYVTWGALHGLALVINHLWRKRKLKMRPALGWLLTFRNREACFLVIGRVLVTCAARNSNEIAVRLRPDSKTFTLLIIAFVWTFVELSKASEFLYFQF